MAAEALELHIVGMLEDREPIPEPSSLDTIMNDPDNWDAVAFLADVPTRRSKSVRTSNAFRGWRDVARHDGDGSEHRAVGIRSIFSDTNSSVALKTGVG